METDKLEALLKEVTPGPWGTKGIRNVYWTVDTDGENSFIKIGPKKKLPVCVAVVNAAWGKDHILDANAALIAAAPYLAAEVLRLRAENAQTVAANAALAAENARLRDFIQELADAKPEVVKSPVDGDGYIEASYFWDWQSDAGKALAGKAGAA